MNSARPLTVLDAKKIGAMAALVAQDAEHSTKNCVPSFADSIFAGDTVIVGDATLRSVRI